MRAIQTIASLCLVLLALGGCAGGPQIDSAAVATIQTGVTTTAELEARFGKPKKQGESEDGSKWYLWDSSGNNSRLLGAVLRTASRVGIGGYDTAETLELRRLAHEAGAAAAVEGAKGEYLICWMKGGKVARFRHSGSPSVDHDK